jgi:hypothetical protein
VNSDPTSRDMESLESKLRQFLGRAPYNTADNPLYRDPYFYRSLLEDFGEIAVTKSLRKIIQEKS